MNNIKTVLFDLDETLIIEWDSARNSFIETINSLGAGIDENNFIKTIREEARKLWYNLPTIEYCLNIGISSREALWADFDGEDNNLKFLKTQSHEYRYKAWNNALSKFGIHDIRIAEDLSERYKEIRNTKHILFPDTIECLELLKTGYKLGLITNGAPDIQRKKITGGKLVNYFDSIIISGEFGAGKPDVRIFREICRQLNCDNTETIMVGDTIGTDIKGAMQSGLKSVWINRTGVENNSSDVQPDFEIKSFSELDICNRQYGLLFDN